MTLEVLFSRLYQRKFLYEKLILDKAPKSIVSKQKNLIKQSWDGIIERIAAIERFQELCDKYYSFCGDCIHLKCNKTEAYCKFHGRDNLPIPEENSICPHFVKPQLKSFSSCKKKLLK